MQNVATRLKNKESYTSNLIKPEEIMNVPPGELNPNPILDFP
jgi:hypothetical protein